MVTIGIPRGLGYFDFDDIWVDFFSTLGVEIVHSPPTNKLILDTGVKLATEGTCLPVKAFYGHIVSLLTRANPPDFLFVPRLIGVNRREFICPKFMGLPDLIRNLLKNYSDLRVRVLAPTVDLRKGNAQLYLSLLSLGLRIRQPLQTLEAYRMALRNYQANKNRSPAKSRRTTSQSKVTIGVIGHSYLLEDRFLSMDLLNKLQAMGTDVIPGYMLPSELIEEKAKEWPKRMFWRSGKIALGAAKAFQQGLPRPIDGVIYVASFGCGTDSITGELVERSLRRAGVPILMVNLDEHTGEAGVLTRLEAFVDLIKWRSTRREVYFSTYGQFIHPNSNTLTGTRT